MACLSDRHEERQLVRSSREAKAPMTRIVDRLQGG